MTGFEFMQRNLLNFASWFEIPDFFFLVYMSSSDEKVNQATNLVQFFLLLGIFN